MPGELGLWDGFFLLFFFMFWLKEKHYCRFDVAWSPPALKMQFII